MPYILGTSILFIQGGLLLGAVMGPCHSCGYLGYKQSDPDTGNFSSFLFAMDMSPTVTIIGHEKDIRIDHIIRQITQQDKSKLLDLKAFPNMISSHMSTVMLHGNLKSVKRDLKFLVLSEIGTIRPLLQKVQQLDRELGAGFLLRHFSRWLVVLTKGDVHSLMLNDIVLDNVAVTTIDNMSQNLCKNVSILQTLVWKNVSRKLQPVSKTPTQGLSSRVFPNTQTGLNGRLVKAAMLPLPFQWSSCKSNNTTNTVTGRCSKLMSHLSEVLNFSYTYVEPADQSWGTYDNGTWDGIMGLLLNKTVDISAVPYAWNPVRANYVTFSYPVRHTNIIILYKKPDSPVDWTVLLSCFQWQVYLCGLVVLAGVNVFFLILKRFTVHQSGRNKPNGQPMLETIMSTTGVTCYQGSSALPKLESQRILLAFWWLLCIPMTSVFSGNVVAFLAASKDSVPFTGLGDLLDSGYGIGVEEGSYITDILSRSNDSVNKQIWKKTREHHRHNLTIVERRMYHRTRLAEGRYAFITDSDNANIYMTETCDMTHSRERMFHAMSSLIVPKHSPLALLMDPELMFMMDRGMIDKWYGMSSLIEKICLSQEEEDNSLEMKDLFTAFIVVGCGVGLATVILVFEICKNTMLTNLVWSLDGQDP